ncbi:unnamed protein product [Onchocerca flexuosa]|uniref:Uncharacterized protein n=1 Tax=Onchocerca flexuosa TaxID=387005 RepID=A0A183HYF0_9BILA|nr:unnamed protein product [Onchocerca flexuosa]
MSIWLNSFANSSNTSLYNSLTSITKPISFLLPSLFAESPISSLNTNLTASEVILLCGFCTSFIDLNQQSFSQQPVDIIADRAEYFERVKPTLKSKHTFHYYSVDWFIDFFEHYSEAQKDAIKYT